MIYVLQCADGTWSVQHGDHEWLHGSEADAIGDAMWLRANLRGVPYEALTTPDAEDLHVVVDGPTVHAAAFSEQRTPKGALLVTIDYRESPIAKFKRAVRAAGRKGSRPLGLVAVVLCPDRVRDGLAMAKWLRSHANVLAIPTALPTEHAIAAMREAVASFGQDREAGHA